MNILKSSARASGWVAVLLMLGCSSGSSARQAGPSSTSSIGTTRPPAPNEVALGPTPLEATYNPGILSAGTELQDVVTALQDAVRRHDRTALMSLIVWPVIVSLDGEPSQPGEPPTVYDQDTFVKLYDRIITPCVEASILSTRKEDMTTDVAYALRDRVVWVASKDDHRNLGVVSILAGACQDSTRLGDDLRQRRPRCPRVQRVFGDDPNDPCRN